MPHPLEGYTIEWWGSPCFTSGRALPWDHFTPHHVAGFGLPSFPWERQASSTYGVQGRRIIQYVSENDSPWTEGNYYANASAITCESVNSWGEPDWGWAEETFDTTARLEAAVLIGRNIHVVTYDGTANPGINTYQHRDLGLQGFSPPTRCPGEWMRANFNRYLNLVQHYLNEYYSPAPPKPEPVIEWKLLSESKILKCKATPTHFYNLKNGSTVKDFNAGDQIIMYAEIRNKEILGDEWFYVTQYSYEKQIPNGFRKTDLEELKVPEPDPPTPEPEPIPSPEPSKIIWTKYDEPIKYECAKQPTFLVNFDITDVSEYIPVKEFQAGELLDIAGEAYNETVGLKFLVTPYSFEKQFTNGFYYEDLKMFVPVVDPIPEEPVDPEPEEPIEEIPNWFIRFIHALIEFLSGLFKKKEN